MAFWPQLNNSSDNIHFDFLVLHATFLQSEQNNISNLVMLSNAADESCYMYANAADDHATNMYTIVYLGFKLM